MSSNQALDDQLTAPGSPFELVREDVLGEPMAVLAARPQRSESSSRIRRSTASASFSSTASAA